MAYSKVERQKWHDERYRNWTRTRRNVWDYLLTNPHMDRPGGRIGCYVIDPLYIAADLSCADWQPTPADMEAELQALHDEERIVWDRSARLVLLLHFFKHNQPENPNVAKAAAADVDELPFSVTVSKGLISAAETYLPAEFGRGQPCGKVIADAARARLEKAQAKSLRANGFNPSERVTPTAPEQFTQPFLNPEPEPEPEQEPEQKEQQIGAPKESAPTAKASPRRWRFVPDTWRPSADHQALALELHVDLDAQAALFRDHEFKEPKSDADRAFSAWLRRAAEMRPRNGAVNGMSAADSRIMRHRQELESVDLSGSRSVFE